MKHFCNVVVGIVMLFEGSVAVIPSWVASTSGKVAVFVAFVIGLGALIWQTILTRGEETAAKAAIEEFRREVVSQGTLLKALAEKHGLLKISVPEEATTAVDAKV